MVPGPCGQFARLEASSPPAAKSKWERKAEGVFSIGDGLGDELGFDTVEGQCLDSRLGWLIRPAEAQFFLRHR